MQIARIRSEGGEAVLRNRGEIVEVLPDGLRLLQDLVDRHRAFPSRRSRPSR